MEAYVINLVVKWAREIISLMFYRCFLCFKQNYLIYLIYFGRFVQDNIIAKVSLISKLDFDIQRK